MVHNRTIHAWRMAIRDEKSALGFEMKVYGRVPDDVCTASSRGKARQI